MKNMNRSDYKMVNVANVAVVGASMIKFGNLKDQNLLDLLEQVCMNLIQENKLSTIETLVEGFSARSRAITFPTYPAPKTTTFISKPLGIFDNLIKVLKY
jgi:hypothetical protein